MNISNFVKKDGEISFDLSGISSSVANAIRRIGMNQIPTLAIESAVFYENSSSFFDEYIANRLAMVPLTTPERFREEDEVLLTLDVQGPGLIPSIELKSSDPEVQLAAKEIPLVKLAEGQSVRLEAKAKLGIGREHARWQTGVITYYPDEKKKDVFHFRVESFGQIPPKKIIERTLAKFDEKCTEFLKNLG